MRKTSAQRYNDHADMIWENAKKLNAKYATLHMLQRLTEKVERANSIQHSGCKIQA